MGSGTSSGKSPHSPTLRKALRTTERSLKDNTYETLVAYDDQGNEVANLSQKNATRVNIDYQTGQKLRDAVATHNHPGFGGTFSDADLKTAVSVGVQELRAFDKDGNYFSIRKQYGRKLGVQPPLNYHRFGTDYKRAYNAYNRNNASPQYHANIASGMSKKQAHDTFVRDMDNFCRDWLKNNATKYGWKYTEGKI